MKPIKPILRVTLATGFVVYLYALMRLILLKWNAPNLPFLYGEFLKALHHPNRVIGSSARICNLIPFKEITNAMGHISLSNPHLALSLGLEVAQLVLYIGTFDVDDLILNTTGGVIGYGVVRWLTRLDEQL